MFLATAVNFGATQVNQSQRVGFFDDSNGAYFEQSNALTTNGMAVGYRSDINNIPTDVRIDYSSWSDPNNIKGNIDWTQIQMLFIEYAWYGAGMVRWGIFLNGEPYVLHEIGFGNRPTQQTAWCRTGNLPVRYEQRNAANPPSVSTLTGDGTTGTLTFASRHNLVTGNSITISGATPSGWNGSYVVTVTSPTVVTFSNATATASVVGTAVATPVAAVNDMIHYGVSVCVEGGVDDQRGFTYSYGTPWNATSANAGRRVVAGSANRIPVVSIRGRTMGVSEYTQANTACTAGSTTSLTSGTAAWTTDQYKGRCLSYVVSGVTYTARIMSNTATVLAIADVVTGGAVSVAPVSGQNYTIGYINRGQLLPRRLQITSDQPVYVELITSTPTSAVNLTGANFVANSQAANSFALIDSSATAFTASGEGVYSIFVPANNPVDQPIDQLFPLVNTIRGNATDILTVLVTNTSATNANVSVQIIGQEAMS
jgi:hypothetical protein